MSNKVRRLLAGYNELDPSISPQIAEIKMDLDRALQEVSLTEEERVVLEALFLIPEPVHPVRVQVNKAGGTAGRPSGGITQSYVATLMTDYFGANKTDNALNIRVSRIIKSACDKLAAFLGPEYFD